MGFIDEEDRVVILRNADQVCQGCEVSIHAEDAICSDQQSTESTSIALEDLVEPVGIVVGINS